MARVAVAKAGVPSGVNVGVMESGLPVGVEVTTSVAEGKVALGLGVFVGTVEVDD